jgi:hypothetical protein
VNKLQNNSAETQQKGASVRVFAPEYWGQVDVFREFHSTTFALNSRQYRAVLGVSSHFRKAKIFKDLAQDLLPSVQLDEEQLEAQGYTPAENSKKVSALIESTILELYSAVDCARKVVVAVYKGARHMPSDSTRKLFAKASDGVEFGEPFPTEITKLLQSSEWYWGLQSIRDNLVHLDIGSMHLNRQTEKYDYTHEGLRGGSKNSFVEDVFGWLSEMAKSVNAFLGQVFRVLNSQIIDKPVKTVCGFVDGYILEREIRPSEVKTKGGTCLSFHWFEREDRPDCPFKNDCLAYQTLDRS